MKKRKIKKKKGGKNNYSGLMIFLFLFAAIYLAYTNALIFFERAKIKADYNVLEKQLSELKQEKENLNMQLGETYTDEYLERVAREELGYYREGEKVIIIKKEEEDQENVKGEMVEKKDFIQTILDYFMSFMK